MSSVAAMVEENNKELGKREIGRMIILYEMDRFFIGDTCRIFAYLRMIRAFFPNVLIDVNIANNQDECFALLKNNRHINGISYDTWDETDFNTFDLVICICLSEAALLAAWEKKYAAYFRPAVFSYSKLLGAKVETVFPWEGPLNSFIQQQEASWRATSELFIDEEERNWGDEWLRQHGMKPHEKLIVFIDDSSKSIKLLPFWVKFQMMNYFFEMPDVKMLIFDEWRYGKKENYKKYLPESYFNRLIIAEGLPLRQEICLLSSRFTRFVFGPCTGLLHCASGVFRTYLNDGMPASDLPVMLVYAGKEEDGGNNDKWYWWQYALAECVTVEKDEAGRKSIVPITKEREYVVNPCADFTAELLVDYIERHYREKLVHFQLLSPVHEMI